MSDFENKMDGVGEQWLGVLKKLLYNQIQICFSALHDFKNHSDRYFHKTVIIL